MSNECLVTKLKASVGDNDLPRLGKLRVDMHPKVVAPSLGGINAILLIGAGKYELNQLSAGLTMIDGNETALSEGAELSTARFLNPSADSPAFMYLDKTTLTNLVCKCMTKLPDFESSCPLEQIEVSRPYTYYAEYSEALDLGKLAPLKNTLKTAIFTYCHVASNIEALLECVNLETLRFSGSASITPGINIVELAALVKLTRLDFNGANFGSVYGSLEDFAVAQWSTYNRKSGSLAGSFSSSEITFNGASAVDNMTITYNANNIVIVGGGTTATYNGSSWSYS